MNCGGEAAGPVCYRVMAPIEVPADLEQLNEHLPPSRWAQQAQQAQQAGLAAVAVDWEGGGDCT